MGKKAILFNELVPKLTEVAEFFGRIGVEIHYSVDGKDSLDLITNHKPTIAVLSVAMPGLSGIEVCRRVKVEDELKETKIVLVSDFENESIRNKAIEAGCDNYYLVSDIPAALYPDVQQFFKAPPRTDLRVSYGGEVLLVEGGKKFKATSVNLSRSGILVACKQNITEGGAVELTLLPDGKNLKQPITLTGTIARSMELESDDAKYNGIGIRFNIVEGALLEKLDSLISLVKGEGGYDFKGKKIDLKPLIDFMLGEDTFFAEIFGYIMKGEDPNYVLASSGDPNQPQESVEKYNFFFPKLQSWEIGAFAGGDEQTEVYLSVVRKLVMFYIKFENCNKVVNDIPYSDPDDEKTLFNVMENALEAAGAAEKQVDQILTSEISIRSVGISGQIAKTKNKYVDSKIRLVKGLVERYQLIANRKPQLSETISMLSQLLDQMKQEFDEKKKELFRPVEEKKPDKKEEVSQFGQSAGGSKLKLYLIFGGAFTALVLFIMIYNVFIAGKVSVDKYAETGIVKNGKVNEGVLNLTVEEGWNPSRDKKVTTETLVKIHEKTKKDRIFKVKLVDEKGKVIGQIMSSSSVSDSKPFIMVFGK